jgi:hypothetical protein
MSCVLFEGEERLVREAGLLRVVEVGVEATLSVLRGGFMSVQLKRSNAVLC